MSHAIRKASEDSLVAESIGPKWNWVGPPSMELVCRSLVSRHVADFPNRADTGAGTLPLQSDRLLCFRGAGELEWFCH